MSQEMIDRQTFQSYLAAKADETDTARVNQPGIRHQVIVEDVIDSYEEACAGMNRLTTTIKSGNNHRSNVIDQCQAIQRLTTNIKNPSFRVKFRVVITSMKKECNAI